MTADRHDLWRRYAELYDLNWQLLPLRQMFAELVAIADITSESRIFDAGCGIGFLERQLSEQRVHPTVVGVDNSVEMLARAMAEHHEGWVLFRMADLDNLNARNFEMRFDRLFLINTIYALADPIKVLMALYELAEPGARLIISTPIPDANPEAIARAHLAAVGEADGDIERETERLTTAFADTRAINEEILATTNFHYPTLAKLYEWLAHTPWELAADISTTYADQNWLVYVTRR